MNDLARPGDVLEFWFESLERRQWFRADAALDRRIARTFGPTLTAASACELWRWRDTPTGRVAEIVVLDQFSRNIHRATAQAFAQDPLALALAQTLVADGHDRCLDTDHRHFAYMPFMHSESLTIHDQALRLYSQPGLEIPLGHERNHRAVLERFGRYPQRNVALGRSTTDAEHEYLAGKPGF
ncbi:DUF924 family protein [Salinisphaera sp. T31B1]|uniref:DUF924 family protein n=1 Tax=Salinisphaera sp. T31B1 TaxID=727963 RepID=UPI00333E9AE5